MEKITMLKYEELINLLHDAEAPESLEDNIIETPELTKLYQEFNTTYIDPIYEERGYDVGTEAYIKLGGMVIEFEKRGFQMGFKTAVSLILQKDLIGAEDEHE